jgi:hypothetical protein
MKGNRIEFSFKDGEFHPEGKFNDFELDSGVKDDTLILRRRVKGIEPSLRDVLNEHDMQVAGSPPQDLLPEDGDTASETPPPVPDSEPTREVHELKQIIAGMDAERKGDRVIREDLEKRLKDAFAQRDAADAFLMKHVDVFNLVKAVDADVQKQHPEFKGEKPVDRVYEYLKWFTSLGATIDELRAKAQEYLSTKARLEQVMSDLKTEKDERGKAEEARGNAESAYKELNGNLMLLRGELSPLASQIKELAGGAIDAEDALDILEQAVPLIEGNKLMLGADASKVAELERQIREKVEQYALLDKEYQQLDAICKDDRPREIISKTLGDVLGVVISFEELIKEAHPKIREMGPSFVLQEYLDKGLAAKDLASGAKYAQLDATNQAVQKTLAEITAQRDTLDTDHKDLAQRLKTVSEEHTAEVQRLNAAIEAEQIRNRTDKSSYELKEAELKGKMDSAGRNLESVRAGYEKDKASLQSRIDALEAAGKKPDEIAKMYEDKVKKLQKENKALELSVVCGEENQKENLVMCAKIIAKEKAKLREEHALALEDVRKTYDSEVAKYQSEIEGLKAGGAKPADDSKVKELEEIIAAQKENYGKLALESQASHEKQLQEAEASAHKRLNEMLASVKAQSKALGDARKTYDSEIAKYKSEIDAFNAAGKKPDEIAKMYEDKVKKLQEENKDIQRQAKSTWNQWKELLEDSVKAATAKAKKEKEELQKANSQALEDARNTYDSEIAKYKAEIDGLKAGGAKPTDDSQVRELEAKVSSLEAAREADKTRLRQALARKDVQRENMETEYRKQFARKEQELLESREELQSARRDFASAPANLVAIIQNWTGKKTGAVSVKPSKRLPVVLNSLYNAYETRFGKDSEQSDALAEVRDVMLGSGSHEKKTGRLADVVTSYSSVFAKQNARTALSAFINAYLLSLNPEKFAKKHAKEYRIINGLRSGVPFGRVAELQAENSSLEWDAVNVKQQNEALEQAAVELRDSYLEARRYNNVLAANEFYQGNYKKAIGLFSRAARIAPYEEQKNDVKMNIAITCLELAEKEKDEKKKARLCSRAQSCLNRQAPDDQLRIEYQKMCYELKSSLTAA